MITIKQHQSAYVPQDKIFIQKEKEYSYLIVTPVNVRLTVEQLMHYVGLFIVEEGKIKAKAILISSIKEEFSDEEGGSNL